MYYANLNLLDKGLRFNVPRAHFNITHRNKQNKPSMEYCSLIIFFLLGGNTKKKPKCTNFHKQEKSVCEIVLLWLKSPSRPLSSVSLCSWKSEAQGRTKNSFPAGKHITYCHLLCNKQGVRKIPWRREANPLQYSCLEIPRTEEPAGL